MNNFKLAARSLRRNRLVIWRGVFARSFIGLAVVTGLLVAAELMRPGQVRIYGGREWFGQAAVTRVVHEVCREHGVPADLVLAMIDAESGFNPAATSPKGAMGLMQLMPGTAAEMELIDPYHPEENIRAGVKYLGILLKQFNGNKEKAVAAYNAGPRTVRRYRGVPPYRETKRYVSKVMKRYNDSVARRAALSGRSDALI